jgi:hypothetical protein
MARARVTRIALGSLGLLLLVLMGVTGWVLESDGVAVIETTTPEGEVRSTHVWYARDDTGLWLEAGTPTNGWFVDVGQNPIVTLVLPESSERYRAVAAEGDAAHARLRALLREKYGFRDWWVGSLLVDSADSIAVRLDPIRP